jgi:SAM-dependent methyltransferase
VLLRRIARSSVTSVLDHVYERRFNVQTSDVILDDDYAEHRTSEGDTPADGELGYLASDWLTLARILKRGEITSDDVFLDAGCGQGRMLLEAASRYPFKRVIGVEISHGLAAVAERNALLAASKLRAPVEVVCGDVTEFEIPDDVTVAFVGNPFADDVFAGFIRRVLASLDRRPRRLRLVYNGPREERQLLESGRFERVRYGRSFLSGAERHRHIVLYEAMRG